MNGSAEANDDYRVCCYCKLSSMLFILYVSDEEKANTRIFTKKTP